jgi:hypothetical protein
MAEGAVKNGRVSERKAGTIAGCLTRKQMRVV